MRVIAGIAKGRSLKSVAGKNTRPTTDKVKEALFSMITHYIDGGNILDLYAGTGALGIEALSRGMDYGIFVDHNHLSVNIIKENLKACKLDQQAEVYKNDAKLAIKALAKRAMQFDVVFLDPPYRLVILEQLISSFSEFNLIKPEGIIVVEHDAKVVFADCVNTFTVIKKARYGQIAITIYQNTILS